MRTYKFRAWEKTQNKFYYFNIYGNNIVVKENPLMQFTGLKDKNGVEIYEGDLIYGERLFFDGGEVIFSDGSYLVRNLHCEGCPIPSPKDREVVGNRYENPELLKEGA